MMERDLKPYEINIHTLGFYINRLHYAMVKRINYELTRNGLDIQFAEYTVFRVLNKLEGISQSQLATVMAKERSGISRTLAGMEEGGI